MANYCLNQCIIKISKVLIDYKIDLEYFMVEVGRLVEEEVKAIRQY